MTTLTTTQTRPVQAGASLRTLTWHEVRRYARHPLFLISLALMVLQMSSVMGQTEPQGTPADLTFFAALYIGLLGTIVAHRLAKSVDVSSEVADVTPVSRATRTAALCLATLFPAAVGAIITALTVIGALLAWSDLPVFHSGMDGLTILCAWLAGVVACAGGPLFGIMVARWTNFPGAGLVAVIALFAWVLIGSRGLAMTEPSRLSALINMLSPAVFWTSADGPGLSLWVVEGSPVAHLAYVITLCLLGATLAIVRDAEAEQRTRLWRVFGVLVVVAVVMLGLSILPDPVRATLNVTD